MASLTLDDQKRIDSVIEDIYLRTGMSYPLDSLLDIAKAEDILVAEGDLSAIGQNISGLIDYDEPTKKTNPRIYINVNIGKERKQFTLAHELGHHFLHKGIKFRLDTLDYSLNNKDTKEESEANYFAASLLVPKNLLLRQMTLGRSIDEIATYFGVSKPVIQNRIKWVNTN
jgi:Zn-dependent peptidase ImmA (M78 family)